MPARVAHFFINSTGALLLAVGLALFISQGGQSGFVPPHDPILIVSMPVVFWIVGAVTLTVGLVCLFGKSPRLKLYLVLWLAMNFLAYQLGLFYTVGSRSFQGYWGNLAETFDLPPSAVWWVFIITICYLLVGGAVSLVWLWLDGRKVRIKTTCAACEGHIAFSPKNLGQQIPCPHCRAIMVLQKPGPLKMTCVLCGGHVEFPSFAIGQKIRCPHCAKPITLLQMR